jgi:capsular polysaccharide export protein
LEQKKHLCLRINLCFADWLFWRRPGARNYRGSLENWSSYLEHFYDSHGVTDLVLHSEQRDHHKIAIDLAKRRGLGVTAAGSTNHWLSTSQPSTINFQRLF